MVETLVVEEVLTRIKQLTGDLEKIRKGYASKIGPVEKSLSANNLFEIENSQTVAELDAAIDDLQHVVWLYTETATARGARHTPSPGKLLSRASDIVCALSARPPLPKAEPGASGASFVERLIKLMESPPDAVAKPDSAGRKIAGPSESRR
ncbi:MAG TPA: hypothetical protein VI636_08410 [Candidatus Angelobacter sp.]